jgi:hypothetical protein
VHAKDLFINHGSTRKTIEAIGKSLPEFNTEASFTLIIETVDSINRGAFVVSTEDKKILGVLDLVCQQQADRFQTLLSTIHIISEKDVVGLWGEPTVFEKAKQIVVLPVYVTTNLDRCFQFQEHRLSDEKIAAPEAQHLDLCFGKIYLLSRPSTTNAVKAERKLKYERQCSSHFKL